MKSNYEPKHYWKTRENPNSGAMSVHTERYIQDRIIGNTLLDFGPGVGRLFPLYRGMEVTGLDIVDTYTERANQKAISWDLDYRHVIGTLDDVGSFDTIVASKVLLHVLPSHIRGVLNQLTEKSNRLIVWDMQCEDPAPHNFSHPYHRLVKMKDVQQSGKELLFICE